MIKVKNVFDEPEESDGQRIWVEPHGLCKDLAQWCKVDHVMPHLGPPVSAWRVFEEHPDAYDFFRATYHEHLRKGKFKPALQAMADAGRRETFTLLHQSDDPDHNSAAALHEFLSELEAYSKPE